MKRMIISMLAALMVAGMCFGQEPEKKASIAQLISERKNITQEQLDSLRQANKAQAKEWRQNQRKIADMARQRDFQVAFEAIKDSAFVLEVDNLVLKYGNMIMVSSMTNFISVRGDRAVVQISPFNAGGPNGVGGITLDGLISNSVLTTDKKGNVRLSFNVQGAGISAAISIVLPSGSGKASANIVPNFNSHRITLTGDIVPLDASRVYKGISF